METSLARSIELLLKCDLKSDIDREAKIDSIITLGDITLNGEYQNSSQFPKIIPLCIVSLLRMMQDKDMNVWSLAEQTLVKVIKTYKTDYQRSIMIEIWNSIRGHERSSKGVRNVNIKMEGRSRRFALEVFSIFASTFKPANLSKFISSLITILSDIVSNKEDQLLQETLSKHFEPIVVHHLSFSTIDELNPLIKNLVENVTSQSSRVRRSVVSCLVTLCKHNIHHNQLITNITLDLFQLLFRAQDEKIDYDSSIFEERKFDAILLSQINFDYIPTTTTQGVLHGLKQVIITSRSLSHSKNPLTISRIKLFLDLGIKSLSVSNDNNIFVFGLELIKEILYWKIIYTDMKSSGIYDDINNLLLFFSNHLFNENTQASAIVLIISCFSAFLKYSPSIALNYILENYQAFVNLMNHYDPMIKSQSFLFLSYLVICKLRNNFAELEEIDVCKLLDLLLCAIQEESSSIVSKLACEGLMMIMNPLLVSEYAHEAINIIYQLLKVKNNNLKGEIITLISSVNYKILSYLENTVNQSKLSFIAPKLETDKSIKDYVFKYIVQHINSNDARIREISSKSLVKMIQHMKYDRYLANKEFMLLKHCRDEIYSNLEKSESDSKTELQFIIYKLLPRVNNTTDLNYLKGFYSFLKELGNEGYQIPSQLVDILADHLRSNILIEDFEVQLDVALILTNILKSSKEFTEDYSMSVFLYLFKILKILHKVMTMQSKSYLKKLKKKYSSFSHIVERINDAHSLSLTSYSRTSFDDICVILLQAITNIIPYVNKNIVNYIDRILIYTSIHLKNYCDIVIDLLIKLLNVTLKYDSKLITKFENIFILCKNYYLSTLSNDDRTKLLIFLSHLIMKGINCSIVDENLLFLELNELFFKKEIKRAALSNHLVASHLLYLVSYMIKNGYVPKDLNGKDCVNKAFKLSWEYSRSDESIKNIIELIGAEYSRNSSDKVLIKYDYIRDVEFAIAQNLIERLPCTRATELLLILFSQKEEKEYFDIYPDIIDRVLNIISINNEVSKCNLVEAKKLLKIIDIVPSTFVKINNIIALINSFSFEHSNWVLNASILLKLLMKTDMNELIKENDCINRFIYNILIKGISAIKHESDIKIEYKQTKILSLMINMVISLVSEVGEDIKFTLPDLLNDHVDELAQKSLNTFYSTISKDLSCLSVLLRYHKLIYSILGKIEDKNWYSRILKNELILSMIEILRNSTEDKNIIEPSLLHLLLNCSFDTTTINIIKEIFNTRCVEFINILKNETDRNNIMYHSIHKFLHILLSIKPNKNTLEIIFDKFLMSEYISVIILCENYIFKSLDSDEHDTVVELIRNNVSLLRRSFLQKLNSLKALSLDILINSKLETFKYLLEDSTKDLDMNLVSQVVASYLNSWIRNNDFKSTVNLEIRTRDEVEQAFNEMYLNPPNDQEDIKISKDLYSFDINIFISDDINFHSWRDTVNLINIVSYCFHRYSTEFIMKEEGRIKFIYMIHLAKYGLQEIINNHTNNNPALSQIDVISIFNYVRDIFYYFEVTYDLIKEVDILQELIYLIYESSFMLFIDKKQFNEPHKSIDQVLNFIWEIIREECLIPDTTKTCSTLRNSFYNMIFALCQSSSSLESLVYPFQSDPINFDFNNDPVHLLEVFLHLINRIPPRYPETFEKVKSQITMGIDPKLKIHKLATSEKIKALSVRILTSLVLCVNPMPNSKFEYISYSDTINLLPIQIVNINSLKENFVYLWKGINISFNLDELLDFFSSPLECYISNKTSELELGKECLRSIVLLSNYFSPNQRLNVFHIFMNIIESQKEIYSEDIIMKSYALFGVSKIIGLVYLIKPDIKDKIITLLKIIQYHILNQNIRKHSPESEEKSLVPMTRYVILLSLAYLSQCEEFKSLIRKDQLIVSFIKGLNEEEIDVISDPKNPHIKELLVEATKNPTEVVKNLCLLCRNMIFHE